MDREGRHLRPTASPWEPYSSSSHASTCFHSSSRHSSHLSVLAFHLVGHTKLLSWATRQRMDLSEWIREENSQCNYQAVDAQRFHERKTQEQQPSYLALCVWLSGYSLGGISCSLALPDPWTDGRQSYGNACRYCTCSSNQRLHPRRRYSPGYTRSLIRRRLTHLHTCRNPRLARSDDI